MAHTDFSVCADCEYEDSYISRFPTKGILINTKQIEKEIIIIMAEIMGTEKTGEKEIAVSPLICRIS